MPEILTADEDTYSDDGLTGYRTEAISFITADGPLRAFEVEDDEGKVVSYEVPDPNDSIWEEWRVLRERKLGAGVLKLFAREIR